MPEEKVYLLILWCDRVRRRCCSQVLKKFSFSRGKHPLVVQLPGPLQHVTDLCLLWTVAWPVLKFMTSRSSEVKGGIVVSDCHWTIGWQLGDNWVSAMGQHVLHPKVWWQLWMWTLSQWAVMDQIGVSRRGSIKSSKRQGQWWSWRQNTAGVWDLHPEDNLLTAKVWGAGFNFHCSSQLTKYRHPKHRGKIN